MRVLIVDDNAEAAQSLGLLLEMHGVVVEVVHDGPSALRRAGEAAPDAVLLDIDLPEMDGYEVATELGRRLGERRPRLVALTGHGHAEARASAAAAGFDVYLVKPAAPEEVLRAIRPGPP
jgi:CheY-like chemotaxis protein